MKGLSACRVVAAMILPMVADPALAQENLDHGKTGAQLYASDCAICHKTPQTLAKSGGLFGLDSFLRQHYTASRESASAIAAYIQTLDRGAPPAKRPPKRSAKGDDKKPGDKPGEAQPADAKPADAKPADAKPAEAKPTDAKPREKKPAGSKPADTKSDG
jgi:cytochrome c